MSMRQEQVLELHESTQLTTTVIEEANKGLLEPMKSFWYVVIVHWGAQVKLDGVGVHSI